MKARDGGPRAGGVAAAKGLLFATAAFICASVASNGMSSVAHATVRAAPAIKPQPKVYGRTPAQSSPPEWPALPRAAKDAPNILLIMTDDVGFGSSSTFGGPIPTPTLDALASSGARYSAFHTTAMCSPTRASLLTGRNPQAVGMGFVTNSPSGYDGYNSVIPKSAGTVAALLDAAGYNTAMIGKGHITPEWEQSAAGPFDRWPTGLGFEYFYGFIGADSSIFEPDLVENTRHVPRPTSSQPYNLDADLADHALNWIAGQHASGRGRPFFLYFAPSAAHVPNQAPEAWLDRFHGKFDRGWDEMRRETVTRQKALGLIPQNAADAPRPANLPRWNDLSPDQQHLYARHMEAFAAHLAFADAQIGRVIDGLRRLGELDNTIIIYIQGDNGAAEEGGHNGNLYDSSSLAGVDEPMDVRLRHVDDIGGINSFPLVPGGWGWAMNAPFPWAKRYASHFGGTRNGMVVAWPGHVRDPQTVRTQFHHVSDIMPTILDVAGVTPPAVLNGVRQMPITGTSMRYTFGEPAASSRRHRQVFTLGENLSIYSDGWIAATTPDQDFWVANPKHIPLEARSWELYDLANDFNEAHDVAAEHPAKLKAMQQLYWTEAARAGILPVHPLFNDQSARPDRASKPLHYSYVTPVSHIPESAAPSPIATPFTIRAAIDVGADGGDGVLVAQGGRYAGYALFLDKGVPAFTYNLSPVAITRLRADGRLTAGRHEIVLSFTPRETKPGAGGELRLMVDGRMAASGGLAKSFPAVISINEGFDVGSDEVSPVDPDHYSNATGRFNGEIERVDFDLR